MRQAWHGILLARKIKIAAIAQKQLACNPLTESDMPCFTHFYLMSFD